MNKKEKLIIGSFLKNLDEFDDETMTLVWDDGSWVIAKFDTCFEDANNFDLDDDDEEFEEYISFAFKKITSSQNPPVGFEKDGGFLISYHNFPLEILVHGKKIN